MRFFKTMFFWDFYGFFVNIGRQTSFSWSVITASQRAEMLRGTHKRRELTIRILPSHNLLEHKAKAGSSRFLIKLTLRRGTSFSSMLFSFALKLRVSSE